MLVELNVTARCSGRSSVTVRETTRCVQIRTARWEKFAEVETYAGHIGFDRTAALMFEFIL